ncbi:alpha/beta fold hydrolase [Streptomyces triculaminicus]|uniref:bifunctional 3-oxoadipate enol-lactonase/4-carboxymuconolactone decarboxylase PcaDC n=1 Tax=Streptomyces triculaminicus TaxID=2816232 RepID=UPI0033FFB5CA
MSEKQTPTLQYRTDGPEEGPVLVLGPALGATWHMWDRQIPEFTRHWRVVRFDLPGHGGAPAQPATTVGELTDRLLATLDALGVERFGYAGCCVSGAMGTDLALRHPDRLASLAVVGSAARFDGAENFGGGAEIRANGLEPVARSAPERWFTPAFASAQPAIVDWAVQMVRTTDIPSYAAACDALAAFDVRAELGRIGVPALVVVGAEDPLTPPAEARVLVAGIPDARLAVVPAARHLAPVEQPAALTDLLVRHFTTAWQARPTLPTPTADEPATDHPATADHPATDEQPATAAAPAVEPADQAPAPIPGFGPPVDLDEEPAGEAAAVPGAALPGFAGAVPHIGFGPAPAVVTDGNPYAAELPAPVAPATAEATPAPATAPATVDADAEARRIRTEVLGDDDAEPAAPTTGFEAFATRVEWGETWARPGLDRRTRFLVTLAVLTAGGHLDELEEHARAALRNGVTPEEIEEALVQTAPYCGLPAARAALAVARRAVTEVTETGG